MLLRRLCSSFSYTLGHKQKLVMFGSWPVGFPTLVRLHQKFGSQNIEVITHPFSQALSHHKNPLQQFCQQHNIVYHTPVSKLHTKQQRSQNWEQLKLLMLSSQNIYKMGVVCSYGYMIPSKIINLFVDKLVLVHPSLIPKYRGGEPIFHAVANGDQVTGVSYLDVVPQKFDTGNLLYQVQYQIEPNKYYSQIKEELAEIAASKIQYVLDNIDQLRPGRSQQQLLIQKPIKKQQMEARIVRSKRIEPNLPAQKIYNLNRAHEAPRFVFKNMPIILQFEPSYHDDIDNKYKPGQLILIGKKLYMKCSDKLIKIRAWQQPTKKQLPVYMFMNQFIGVRKDYQNNLFVE